jgi:hypothetical protein
LEGSGRFLIEVLYWNFPGRIEENLENIDVVVLAEIRSHDFLNTNVERYRYTILLRDIDIKLSMCHEGVWGSGCIDPRILDLGISWR